MYLKRYFVEGLAHASYLFGADGEAAIVDPKRDVDDYLADAQAQGLKIIAVLNTHPHADFASGFHEIVARTGAKLYTSHLAPVKYERVSARDGQKIKVGSLEIEMLETPGHSPDSLSFLVREGGRPMVVFTGDLLFVNDVGRPDLRDADSDPRKLADALYDSLFKKILSLPDDVKVYPAHGAGSLCGRALGSAPFTTVGQEKQQNWAAQIKDRTEFVKQMLANLPDRPAYFSFDVGVNLRGAKPFTELPALRALTELEAKNAFASGAAVIDIRSAPFFGAGHFPGSLNIGLGSAMFSTWVGFFVPGDSSIVLIVGEAGNAAKARLELARIGFDNVMGYLEGDALKEKAQVSQLSVCDLKSGLKRGDAPLVLDVRTPGEWKEHHIDGAQHLPLPTLPKRINEVPRSQPVAVICGSGYRSSIGASLLLRTGHNRVANVMGGMGAYSETKCAEMVPAELVFHKNGHKVLNCV
jgi:glyoxylase-like metal-dependent hydrolase (beta-lactamase superfamily II)/rhodanese-related sulfurtransferase